MKRPYFRTEKPRTPTFSSNPRIPFQMSHERPALAPPVPGKPLIVHLLVAVEHWRYDDAIPRTVIPTPHGLSPVPDLANWGWSEYGMRTGMPRIMRALSERGVKADACMNAGVLDAYPSVAEEMLKLDWEFQAHGMHQRAMPDASEQEIIAATIEKIEKFTGVRPRGWTSPGFKESENTLDYLSEAGIKYTLDWIVDDLPCWIRTRHEPMVAVPYTVELNDSVIFAVEKHSSSEQYDRLKYSLEALDPILEETPQVISINMHHHLNGGLHRIGFVEKMLDLLLERPDTVFMTGGEITDWFIEADKVNDGKPNQGKFFGMD